MNKVFALFNLQFVSGVETQQGYPVYTYSWVYPGYVGPGFVCHQTFQISWASSYNPFMGYYDRNTNSIVNWSAWVGKPYDMGPTYE